MTKMFEESQIRAIADALGDTSCGLTGNEIRHLLSSCKMHDHSPEMTKRHRIFNAFIFNQNSLQNRRVILGFIRKSMKPERYIREPDRYEPLRENLNRAWAFSGLAILEDGTLVPSTRASTLSEADERAAELRSDLLVRKIHPDILAFCKAELLHENYFHAILEATKSVAQKLRNRTGLEDDGAALVDRALGGDLPILSISDLVTESEKSEQRGFANFVKGVFGMFRNTTAHSPKISWAINKVDAEEAFTILSMIHRRIDGAKISVRVHK